MSTVFWCNHFKILRCCLIAYFALYNTAIRVWPTLSVFANIRARNTRHRHTSIYSSSRFSASELLSSHHNIICTVAYHTQSLLIFCANICDVRQMIFHRPDSKSKQLIRFIIPASSKLRLQYTSKTSC